MHRALSWCQEIPKFLNTLGYIEVNTQAGLAADLESRLLLLKCLASLHLSSPGLLDMVDTSGCIVANNLYMIAFSGQGRKGCEEETSWKKNDQGK